MKIGGIVIGCDKWNRHIITFSNYSAVAPHTPLMPSPPEGGDRDKERENERKQKEIQSKRRKREEWKMQSGR